MLPDDKVLDKVLVALLDALPVDTVVTADGCDFMRLPNGKWKWGYEWDTEHLLEEFPWDEIFLPDNARLFEKLPISCQECSHAVKPGGVEPMIQGWRCHHPKGHPLYEGKPRCPLGRRPDWCPLTRTYST